MVLFRTKFWIWNSVCKFSIICACTMLDKVEISVLYYETVIAEVLTADMLL